MTYVIGDIHGCYDEYKELLKKINFSENDELYVLGDAMDRGPDSIKVLLDLMQRPNVTYILGNHDHMMLSALESLNVEITEESIENLNEDTLIKYEEWLQEGGSTTAKQFLNLSKEKRADVIDYLENASLYETIEYNGILYVLVHAGIGEFDPEKELEEYDAYTFMWDRTDYYRQYFPTDKIKLVTGHTPTPLIREDRKPLVYSEYGHIALDCGCVFGGQLAALCVETEEITYVPAAK